MRAGTCALAVTKVSSRAHRGVLDDLLRRPDLYRDHVAALRLGQDVVDAAGDVLGLEHFHLPLLAILLGPRLFLDGRVDGAGFDEADADAPLVHVLPQRLGERLNGGLRRGVDVVARLAQVGAHRADHQDVALAFGEHAVERGARAGKVAEDVHVERVFPVFPRAVEQRLAADRGVVDEDVDAAKFFVGFAEDALDVFALRHVTGDAEGFAAGATAASAGGYELAQGFVEVFLISTEDQDAGAVGDEQLRRRAADAGRRAVDRDGFAR